MTPLQNAPSQYDPTDADQPSAEWEIAVAGRSGQPPLRYKGRKIASVHRDLANDAVIFVDIWERKKGDFVVAYSDVTEKKVRHRAIVVDDIDALATHLEDICNGFGARADVTSLPFLLDHALQIAGQQQQFAILTGDILARVDAIQAAST